MKFLESLYNIENFGIYLFIVIGILFILFLVILFFGKKDEKKRKLEATVKLEQEKQEPESVTIAPEAPLVMDEKPELHIPVEQTMFQEITEPTPVEAPKPLESELSQPILEPIKEPSLSDIALEQISELNKVPERTTEFDFDALAAEINKELESIERKEEPVKSLNETVSPVTFSVPEKKEVESPQIQEHVEPKLERTMSMPTVFSSVYVNREKEQPIVEKKEEPVVTPVAPKIELPKIIDLPKKNNE